METGKLLMQNRRLLNVWEDALFVNRDDEILLTKDINLGGPFPHALVSLLFAIAMSGN